jgi:hypothetical protein
MQSPMAMTSGSAELYRRRENRGMSAASTPIAFAISCNRMYTPTRRIWQALNRGRSIMPKPLELGSRDAGNEDRVSIGLATASLLRRVRAQGNPLVSYYFEMAWTAYYQSMDEITRLQIAEGLEDAR